MSDVSENDALKWPGGRCAQFQRRVSNLDISIFRAHIDCYPSTLHNGVVNFQIAACDYIQSGIERNLGTVLNLQSITISAGIEGLTDAVDDVTCFETWPRCWQKQIKIGIGNNLRSQFYRERPVSPTL